MLLALDDVGPGPVVVLIHGFPFDRTMWHAQTAEIGSIYRIIAPDLRGHGSTAAPDGVYTVDLMADDVIETLDALNLTEPVVIGGLSMGGYIALSIAARYPSRVRGLILMNTRAGSDSPTAAQGREDLALTVERSGRPDPVVEAMMPKLFSPATPTRHPEVIERIKTQMMSTRPLALANTLRGLAIRPDRTADLGRINVPTLVLAGADDTMIPIEESERLASGIAGATLAIIPEGGHLAPVENKTAANAAILDFLGSIDDNHAG